MLWKDNKEIFMKLTLSITGLSLYWWMYTVKICVKKYKKSLTLKKVISTIKYYMFLILGVVEDRIFWNGDYVGLITWLLQISVLNVLKSMKEDGMVWISHTDFILHVKILPNKIFISRWIIVIMILFQLNFVSIICLELKRGLEQDSTPFFQTFSLEESSLLLFLMDTPF